MKRRLLSAVLSAAMVMSMTAASYAAEFSDVAGDAWYSGVVNKMADQGAINGYPDGTFRPEATITVAEFTKLTVALVDGTREAAEGEQWYQPYMDRAAELGILPSGISIADAEKNISRENMAGIIDLAAVTVLKEAPSSDSALEDKVKAKITDYSSIGTAYSASETEYKSLFVDAYLKGLVTGMTATTFEPTANATRAQAATMISRLTDKASRADATAALNDAEEPQATTTDLGGIYMDCIHAYLDSLYTTTTYTEKQLDFTLAAADFITLKENGEEMMIGTDAKGNAVIEYDLLDLGTLSYVAASDGLTVCGVVPGQSLTEAAPLLTAKGFAPADPATYGDNSFLKTAYISDQGTVWYSAHMEVDGSTVKSITLGVTSDYAG